MAHLAGCTGHRHAARANAETGAKVAEILRRAAKEIEELGAAQ